ncbi:hypothetical protein [Pseudomonas putida]|uniref:DUF3077 domain-containing protein n=1 Tax=Pseudomonas putida TaxID=303 RepID=A0A177SNJ2_PSEPU|nr:hypothetical protein [Pseudomonas putida]OAI91266.1 hypothetical protein AYO28_22190 [Pseudomonas putida]
MSKIVSDLSRITTVYTPFGASNDGRKPLFAVCDGVDIEDALVHLSMTLKSAFETNLQVCERVDRAVGGVAWATGQSLEVGLALVAALLGGVVGEGDGG